MDNIWMVVICSVFYWFIIGVVTCLIVHRWDSFFSKYKYALTAMLNNFYIVVTLSIFLKFSPGAAIMIVAIDSILSFILAVGSIYVGRRVIRFCKMLLTESTGDQDK